MTIEEKRKFYRIDTSLLVDYEIVNGEEIPEEKTGVAENISEGGLSIDLPEHFLPETLLRIKFNLPTLKIDEYISGIVKVVWSKPAEFKNTYTTGVCFIKISKSDMEKLKKYLFHIK